MRNFGVNPKRKPTAISRIWFWLTVIAVLFTFQYLFSAYAHASPRRMNASNIEMISNPGGCPARLFCACGLARHWGIWRAELNKVSVWPKHFPRASGPGVGVAAVRGDNHHIIGIEGGGPGAWQVVDFNSGGHASRRYTAASFPGYYFLNVKGAWSSASNSDSNVYGNTASY